MKGISSRTAGSLENKFKYNGKELQSNEFSDGSGLDWEDYGARMQDPQLGRWAVIDRFAEKYDPISPYSYSVNNPMRYVDINGESLGLSGNTDAAQSDILLFLPEGLRSRVSVNDKGNVAFNTDGLSKSQLNDPGVALLNNLVTSPLNFQYSVSENATVREVEVNALTGEKIPVSPGEAQLGVTNPSKPESVDLLGKNENGVMNAANTPFGPVGKTTVVDKRTGKSYEGNKYSNYYMTADNGVNGAVTISPTAVFVEPAKDGSWTKPKGRGNAAFHELGENYYRALGQPYQQAHASSVADEKKFSSSDSRRSNYPGVARMLPTH